MSSLQVSPAGSFNDTALKPLLDMYRQVVAQRYTPCGPTDVERLLGAAPFHVSRKVDGELWFIRVHEGTCQLIAANGRTAEGDAPVATAQVVPDGTVLAGELYVPNDGKRERVGDVAAALAADSADLAFAAFDVIEHAGTSWREMTYTTRMETLVDLLPDSGPVHAAPVTTVESGVDVSGLYTDLVSNTGAEGLVVRCSDGRVLKVKPEVSLDVAILGFTTREGAGGEEVRSVLVGLHNGDAGWVPLSTVGNFMEGLDRSHLLEILAPLEIPSSFRKAASSGQLYRMVRPDQLLECRVLDVQTLDTKERPIRRPALTQVDGRWQVSGQIPAATLISPSVIRLRNDKAGAEEGARWQQIETLVGQDNTATTAAVDPTIIRRQVWTKVSKEKTDVRKLVVWKTNKETVDPDYPAYVVHWTDYSAGRKTPLTREVRPAFSEDSALALAEALIESNIKKGWVESIS